MYCENDTPAPRLAEPLLISDIVQSRLSRKRLLSPHPVMMPSDQPGPPHALSGCDVKAFALAAACVLVALTALGWPLERWSRPPVFLEEHVFGLNLFNAIRQRTAHAIWVLVTLALMGLVLFGPTSLASRISRPVILSDGWLRTALDALLVAVILAGAAVTVLMDAAYAKPALFGAFGILVLTPWIRKPLGATMLVAGRFAWPIVAVYAAIMLLPGFFGHGSFDTGIFVRTVDYHYAVILGSADLLRDPTVERGGIRFNFGLLSALSAADLASLFRIETFGGYIRLIQAYQVAFVFVLIGSAWIWSRGNRLFALLVCVVTAPWVSTLHMSVIAPNQSGYRMIGFAALPALIAILTRIADPSRQTAAAVACSTLLLAWNLETGLAATAGLVATSLLRSYRDGRRLPGLALQSVAMLGAITASVAVIYALVLRGGVSATSVEHLVGFLRDGYGGLEHKYDLTAVAAALLVTVILLEGSLAARGGSLGDTGLMRMALSATVMVWFAYYANRAAAWNMWGLLLLCAFLAEPMTRGQFWAANIRQHPRVISSPALVLAIMATALVSLQAHLFLYRNRAISLRAVPNYQGLDLDPRAEEHVRSQATTLASAPTKTVYLSAAPFLMAQASLRHNHISAYDPFGEIWTPERFGRMMQDILLQQPERVLVEPDSSPLLAFTDVPEAERAISLTAGTAMERPRRAFFNRIRRDLAENFINEGQSGGWEVWRPRGP
jgi:hypothetical protein